MVDHPAMNAHYVQNNPIDLEVGTPVDEAIKIMEDFNTDLVQVVKKYVANHDVASGAEILAAVKKIESRSEYQN